MGERGEPALEERGRRTVPDGEESAPGGHEAERR